MTPRRHHTGPNFSEPGTAAGWRAQVRDTRDTVKNEGALASARTLRELSSRRLEPARSWTLSSGCARATHMPSSAGRGHRPVLANHRSYPYNHHARPPAEDGRVQRPAQKPVALCHSLSLWRPSPRSRCRTYIGGARMGAGQSACRVSGGAANARGRRGQKNGAHPSSELPALIDRVPRRPRSGGDASSLGIVEAAPQCGPCH